MMDNNRFEWSSLIMLFLDFQVFLKWWSVSTMVGNSCGTLWPPTRRAAAFLHTSPPLATHLSMALTAFRLFASHLSIRSRAIASAASPASSSATWSVVYSCAPTERASSSNVSVRVECFGVAKTPSTTPVAASWSEMLWSKSLTLEGFWMVGNRMFSTVW